jgi:SAM-dependent methyltransferase
MEDEDKKYIDQEILTNHVQMLRDEFTVLPRFGYHQPLDYHAVTLPPKFDKPVSVEGVEVLLPGPNDRMGYSPDDQVYLEWGKYDHDLVVERILEHGGEFGKHTSILDFGCSTGRVLRHFHAEHKNFGTKLQGIDIQAFCIEWLRQHFPNEFEVTTGTVLPHLPYEDNSIDYIYGFSVFTHIKFLWDAWILELRRVLKPGGLLLQTFHGEHAWEFYNFNRNEDWVRNNHTSQVYDNPKMDVDFLYFGDISVSQVFWKNEVARSYWSRYMDVLEIYPPSQKHSFQDMIVCRKPVRS